MLALCACLGISLFSVYVVWNAYTDTQTRLDASDLALSRFSQQLGNLSQQLQAAAQYVTVGNITLSFAPWEPVQTISGNIVTYLLGFATVSNLTNIAARPLTLTLSFQPRVRWTGRGNVTYIYTPSQTLAIPPSLDLVQVPWGAFPVTIQGFEPGDEIDWTMTVKATVYWLGNLVTQAKLTATFKLFVV